MQVGSATVQLRDIVARMACCTCGPMATRANALAPCCLLAHHDTCGCICHGRMGVCPQQVSFAPVLAAGLLTEALAMVDKLVLERAQAFVGFQASSFGWCAPLARCDVAVWLRSLASATLELHRSA